MDIETEWYSCRPDPDNPGWHVWGYKEIATFSRGLGVLGVRREEDHAIIRLCPHEGLTNFMGGVHGGALMTFIDSSMFIGSSILVGGNAAGGVTVDLSVQFIHSANPTAPIDTIIQVSRETRRMVFLRGTVEQNGAIVSTFIGIIRKPAG